MKYTNNTYDKLSNIGTYNGRNRVTVYTATGQIGVAAETAGSKKATTVDLYIPTRRSGKGSRRVTHLELDGAQARELYESLSRYYETRPE